MTMLLRLCGIAVIAAIFSYIIKKQTDRSPSLFVILSFVLILSYITARIYPAISSLRELTADNLSEGYFTLMLKALGISLIVKTVTEICEQMGETALSSAIEMAGRAEIFILCIPYILETVGRIKELLS